MISVNSQGIAIAMDYDDFELQIGPRNQLGCLVRVLESPAGHGESSHPFPLCDPVPRNLTSGEQSVVVSSKELGGELFRSLFSGMVGQLFIQSLSHVQSRGRGLRVRLHFNPQDRSIAGIEQLPWELLYREDTADYLGLSRSTPIVRSLDIPRAIEVAPIEPPLRILIVSSQVSSLARLDLRGERTNLQQILGKKAGIELHALYNPDTAALRQALVSREFHVLHFMGHGTFDSRTGEGALVLSAIGEALSTLTGRQLAIKLNDRNSLRLVVLNACETAVSSRDTQHDPFDGVASALLMGGIPAVIAMRSPIDDRQAIAFSSALYEELIQGHPLEVAITEGRQAIHSLAPTKSDWAVPALFLRAPHGKLFLGLAAAAGSRRRRASRRSFAFLLAITLTLSGSIAVYFHGGQKTNVADKPLPPQRAEADPPPSAPLTQPAAPSVDRLPSAAVRPPRSSGDGSWSQEHRTVLIGDGSSRLEIVPVNGTSLAFLDAVEKEAKNLAASQWLSEPSAVSSWQLRLQTASPTITPQEIEGMNRSLCLMAASGTLGGGSKTFSSGSVEAVQSDSSRTIACNRASEVLAGVLMRRLAQQLREDKK